MDFELTPEQSMLQKTIRDFTTLEIEPLAVKIDEEGKVPEHLPRKLAEVGLLGMTVPRKYGGTEAGNLNCILAIEQLEYAGSGAWWFVGFNNSIPESIVRFGSEELKEKYLPSICNGSACASIQFTEEETGSDPDALKTTAQPDGDYYLVNGTKRLSTFGARGGFAVLYARDETGKCSAFVVDKNVPGYSISKTWQLMGRGGIEAVDVYLEKVKVSKENLLGKKGEGFNVLLCWIAMEKVEQCAACVGIGQAALDEAVKYAKLRMVRGKPMASMQGIRWMLAEMKAKVEAARWLTYRAAFLQDRDATDWITEAAAAKVFVVPAMIEVVELSKRIHGAYGYTRDFKIERLYRAIAGASQIATSLEINKSIVGASLVR